jgi:hypothetical protein
MQSMLRAALCHISYLTERKPLLWNHRIVNRAPLLRAATEHRNQAATFILKWLTPHSMPSA